MNRLTAIGLASLAAYGLLLASKYPGIVSAARPDSAPASAVVVDAQAPLSPTMQPVRAETPQSPLPMATPVARVEPGRTSPVAVEFRTTRDLKAFSDMLSARRSELTGDERYHLARALEECQFATTVNEDLAAYSAKKKREFLSSLPAGDSLNPKRVAAYDSVDNTQRCLGFQNAKISPRDIEELFRMAAQQGDARAQARLVTAELGAKNNSNNRAGETQNTRTQPTGTDEMSRLIGLLEKRDPEAMLIVGDYLSRQASQLRVGPNGETPEPSALLGAFSLVACDLGQDCSSNHREPLQACAYAGYCNAQSFEELYQNFLASPWAYTQAIRYRGIIHTAISTRNWSLIGLVPPQTAQTYTPQ